METTRREFIGTVGTVGAATVAAAASGKSSNHKSNAPATKSLYYVAAPTPCAKSLKFDEGL